MSSPTRLDTRRLPFPRTDPCIQRPCPRLYLNFPGRRFYFVPHVQEFLVHLDPACNKRLARWFVDVRVALSESRAFPRFLVVKPAPQEARPPELSSSPVGEEALGIKEK